MEYTSLLIHVSGITDNNYYHLGDEAKSIWTKLSSCHRDALRRRRKFLRSGAAADTPKEWKIQKQMEFSLPYMVNRKRVANLHDIDDEESQTLCENVDVETGDMEAATVDEDGETQNDDLEVVNVMDRNGNSAESEKGISASAMKKTISKASHKKTKTLDMASLLQRSIMEREHRAKERAAERQKLHVSKPTDDPLYHFFISMYHSTQKMPPEAQRFVRKKLFEAVDQAEAALLNPSVSLASISSLTPSNSTMDD
jgi:hypothetical protein